MKPPVHWIHSLKKAVRMALNQASIGAYNYSHCSLSLYSPGCWADCSYSIRASGKCGSHDQLVQNIHGPYSAMVQLQRAFMNDKTVAPSEAIESNKSSS
ncbi:hypothetical protein LOK49_LG04G02206 [Camellia lanceoleosa]|uniref:Uncharacterized protein n=1 Tax=Camellia lanceoleosa TaxID=1840588 RepID=A0ACC0I3L1_9ERIC|nr:hypothetical protein LOK49_LG04G02206 [Camellia lanceoleosa]